MKIFDTLAPLFLALICTSPLLTSVAIAADNSCVAHADFITKKSCGWESLCEANMDVTSFCEEQQGSCQEEAANCEGDLDTIADDLASCQQDLLTCGATGGGGSESPSCPDLFDGGDGSADDSSADADERDPNSYLTCVKAITRHASAVEASKSVDEMDLPELKAIQLALGKARRGAKRCMAKLRRKAKKAARNL